MFTLESKNGIKSQYKLPPLKTGKEEQSKSKENRRKQMFVQGKTNQ